jgi:hypothetical protein
MPKCGTSVGPKFTPGAKMSLLNFFFVNSAKYVGIKRQIEKNGADYLTVNNLECSLRVFRHYRSRISLGLIKITEEPLMIESST